MKTYNNCYYCIFYIEDTCKCELGYVDDSECDEWKKQMRIMKMSEKIFEMLDLFYANKHLYEKIKRKRKTLDK